VTFSVHEQRAPLLSGQRVQSSLEAPRALGKFEHVEGAGSLVRDGGEQCIARAVPARAGATLGAASVERDVTRHAEQPRPEWDRTLRSAPFERAPKDLGRAIVDLRGARREAEHVARHGEHGGAQGRELAKGVGLDDTWRTLPTLRLSHVGCALFGHD
jgi:hypothetical protein